jgi:ASC-1-like (ASCH) protein
LQTLSVMVVGLHRYDTFKELFLSHDPQAFGGVSVAQLLDQIYEFYTPEDERAYGVVGIQIK